jgi:hypothetical protein
MISSVTLNRLIMIAALSALASACADVPRDPEGTLRSVQGGRANKVCATRRRPHVQEKLTLGNDPAITV